MRCRHALPKLLPQALGDLSEDWFARMDFRDHVPQPGLVFRGGKPWLWMLNLQ